MKIKCEIIVIYFLCDQKIAPTYSCASVNIRVPPVSITVLTVAGRSASGLLLFCSCCIYKYGQPNVLVEF
jgi:hypothetical protein